MNLIVQIKLIIFSLIYGAFLSFTLSLNYRFIYESKLIYKIIINFMYVIVNALLYFYILLKINDGILHYYSFICILIGFLIENSIVKRKRI